MRAIVVDGNVSLLLARLAWPAKLTHREQAHILSWKLRHAAERECTPAHDSEQAAAAVCGAAVAN
eukprot:SAG11_NODE_22306_length_408_cov_1.038835_1_plen_64_part_01